MQLILWPIKWNSSNTSTAVIIEVLVMFLFWKSVKILRRPYVKLLWCSFLMQYFLFFMNYLSLKLLSYFRFCVTIYFLFETKHLFNTDKDISWPESLSVFGKHNQLLLPIIANYLRLFMYACMDPCMSSYDCNQKRSDYTGEYILFINLLSSFNLLWLHSFYSFLHLIKLTLKVIKALLLKYLF